MLATILVPKVSYSCCEKIAQSSMKTDSAAVYMPLAFVGIQKEACLFAWRTTRGEQKRAFKGGRE